MSHITLTEEQSQVVEQAREPVEVRDRWGNVVAHILDPRQRPTSLKRNAA